MNKEEIKQRLKELKTEKKQLKKQLESLPVLDAIIGNWYWAESGGCFGYLILLCDGSSKYNSKYWITKDGEHIEYLGSFTKLNRPATDKEVETALIKEAKKRYKKGDIIDYEGHKGKIIGSIYWASGSKCVSVETDNNTRNNENFPLMIKGKWAEIIEQPKTITLNGEYNKTQLTDIINNRF